MYIHLYNEKQTNKYKIWCIESDIDTCLEFNYHDNGQVFHTFKYFIEEKHKRIVKKHYEEKGWMVKWSDHTIELKPKILSEEKENDKFCLLDIELVTVFKVK